ncbi:hypothetical protein [Neorhodopirellula pilleata]|uniref:Uncharacterized protein n=1 Tax=Neorhodopirellula pilleata TaxID=2714738 RepID=A0A5C6A1Z7_9BACT|nr:hypothetical protein [Neorhodopirellula pilleata]TWT93569.1 hypothetical protein Pla100_40870 [Neorhodopirellula pilleata]
MLFRLFACLAVASLTGLNSSQAQLVVQQVPFQSAGNSYYDATGLTWGVNGPGFFANFNGNGAVAPFGNFDPNAGLRTGVGFRNGPWSGHLGLTLNQGSSRSNQSTTASLTTTDGYPGSITSQTVRPFVTGVVPIVGGAPVGFIQDIPPVTSTGQQNLASVAQQQLAEVQQRQQANHDARQKTAYQSFQRGLKAEQDGNLRMARANYQNALRVAEGELRVEILKRVQANNW